MSVLFQTVINTGKVYSFRKSINTQLTTCKCLLVRKYSDVPRKIPSFDEVEAQRRAEARRSLVVQVNSDASFSELYGYCSKYAAVSNIHHYRNPGDEHFMLIEFSTEDDLKDVLQTCASHHKDADVSPLQSPFLWFRAMSGKKEKIKIPDSISLGTKNGIMIVDEDKLFEDLAICGNVSEQIQTLYDRTALNDIGIRLRYMVARQLECVFESLYANVAVRPFGSSVNGFGRVGCDLDLVLTNDLLDEMADSSKRLIYQEKKCDGGRSPGQRHMELVGEVIELRVPGAARLQRILHATVPILKYHHHFAGVDCDLCYNNVTGIHMSALLWRLGAGGSVRPLAVAVRRWAAAAGLTSAHPGRWITNFPLTLMVLFFLQRADLLPAVNDVLGRAGKKESRPEEATPPSPQPAPGPHSTNLETLLLQFFEFYAQFDFQDKAISINEGAPIRKPTSHPLYIVNPLEPGLNVSKNVSFEEMERLKVEVRNAAWQLDASFDRERTGDWGLLGLIEKKSMRNLKRLLRVGNSHRLVSVKDLFKDGEDEPPKEGLRSKLKRLTQKTENDDGVKDGETSKVKKEPLKFKNSQVASEVYRIRRDKIV